VLLKVAAEKKYRVFLLGATPDSVEEAATRLRRDQPDLLLAGYYSPPFTACWKWITRRSSGACAKRGQIYCSWLRLSQAEKWMAMHYRELGVPVIAAVGATIDFLAGRVKRARPGCGRRASSGVPAGLRTRRLSVLHEGLWVFGWRILAQCCCCMLPRLSAGRAKMRPGRWWDAARWVGRHCIIDLSGLRSIDSTDAGILLTVQKKTQSGRPSLVLASASRGVQRALGRCG